MTPLLRMTHQTIAFEAIKCIPCIFEYYTAHDLLRQNPNLILQIYEKIEDDFAQAPIKAQAYKCLITLLQYMKSGSFNLINKTAIKHSRQIGKSTYTGLIKSLTQSNKDAWYDALTLINALLVKCPSDKKRS